MDFRKIIGLFLVLVAMSMCVGFASAVNVGTLSYSGSGKLCGHIDVVEMDGKNIMSHSTYSGHCKFKKDLSHDSLGKIFLISQSVSGAPANCNVMLIRYYGGNVSINFHIGNIWKASGSKLSVTYQNSTFVADHKNSYFATGYLDPDIW